MKPTPAQRAARGRRVLTAYVELVTGSPFTLEIDDQDMLASLLRDLRHMSGEADDIDFGKALHDSTK